MENKPESSAKLKLVGTDGSRFYAFDLENGQHTLGRKSECDFYVPDKTISRLHAILEIDENSGECSVTDQQSHNGTTVNLKRISERMVLKQGDRISFGQVEFRLADSSERSESLTKPTSTRLSEAPLEKSVYLSIDEALKPIKSSAANQPDLLPVFSDMARMLVLHDPKEVMLTKSLELIAKVIKAERFAVLVTSEDQTDILTAASLEATGKSAGSLNLSKTIIDDILKSKQAILISDSMNDPRYAEQASIIISSMKSAIAVPIFDEGEVHGILYADSTNIAHVFTDHHLRLLATFGNIIASRLQNYTLAEQREEKKILDAELKRASSIQQRLLVSEMPALDSYSVNAYQDQCRAVGGDLYDVNRLPDGRLVFLLADVSGKGMGAALLMANILASFRILFGEPKFDLARAVTQVNRQLVSFSGPEDFATLFVGVIDPTTNKIEYINAGHNPPMMISASGKIDLLDPCGIMIGAFDLSGWEIKQVEMNPGDLILLFTDGVTEAEGPTEQYGETRLTEFLTANFTQAPELIKDNLVTEIDHFACDTPQSDDITLMLVKRNN